MLRLQQERLIGAHSLQLWLRARVRSGNCGLAAGSGDRSESRGTCLRCRRLWNRANGQRRRDVGLGHCAAALQFGDEFFHALYVQQAHARDSVVASSLEVLGIVVVLLDPPLQRNDSATR